MADKEYVMDEGDSPSAENNERNALIEMTDAVVGDDNVSVSQPFEGLKFTSMQEVEEYYKKYAAENGFGICRRSSRKDADGSCSGLTLACSSQGKHKRSNILLTRRNSSMRSGCKARLQAVATAEGSVVLTVVENRHNHVLSPSKARHHSTHKRMDMMTKRKLDLNDSAGIRICKSFHSLVVEAGGHENLSFGERECRNYIAKERRWKRKEGDAGAMCKYFSTQQRKNQNFFYEVDLDDEFRVKNVLWVDARSREAYKEFGDVVTFDTTYLTNKYDMPFALFVGVNHHGQSILFGCALLSHEDTESFVWLFRRWLECMENVAPAAIITDQCKAITNALETVFPDSRHRLCLFHIMRKFPEKLRGYRQYENLKRALQNVVYESISREEFDERWKNVIEKYSVDNNDWLRGMWEMRGKWVPAFVKDTFWAGMSTTGRSEAMNAFFDGYLHSTTSLQEFVCQYDNALLAKVEKETKADYESMARKIPCASTSPLEKQFQSCYTLKKFQEVQVEFIGRQNCYLRGVSKEERIWTYTIGEDILVNDISKVVMYMVAYQRDPMKIKCQCQLFEFKGIICRHSLVVLTQEQVKLLAEEYILRRWRKDIKRRHSHMKVNVEQQISDEKRNRFDEMCKSFYELAEMAMITEDATSDILRIIGEVKSKLPGTSEDHVRVEQESTSTPIPSEQQNRKVVSPVAVPRKGRPRVNRRLSLVEEHVQRKKRKKATNLGNTVGDRAEIMPHEVQIQPSYAFGSGVDENEPRQELVNQVEPLLFSHQQQARGYYFTTLLRQQEDRVHLH